MLRSLISDAAAATGVNTVNLTKSGTGKWVLTGNNTYTGLTRVENGVLSITNPFLADANDVRIFSGGTLDLSFSGNDTIDEFFIDGAPQAAGLWGAIGNAGATFQTPFITGTGLLNVGMFTISMLAGDYNQNGIVDAADYIVWREAAGAGATTLTNRSGAITGAVGQADYDFWRSRFGLTVVTGSALNTGANVPEPAAGLLAILAMLTINGRSNRRSRSA
jgi:autotransporter-associated beta strand protein